MSCSGGVNEKPLCIIPARGNSKRFPRKNLALLAGKPLLTHAVETARASGIFETICISSEDEEILQVAKAAGADLALRRPEALSGDDVQVKTVCLELLKQFGEAGRSWNAFGILVPTNPLRSTADVRDAYEIFKREDANYCMSLAPYSHPPQRAVRTVDGRVEAYFGNEFMKPVQTLDPLYRHDGTVIFANTEVFLKEQEFYGSRVVPYFTPLERSVDIDNPQDLAWAEWRLARSRQTEAVGP